MPIRAECHSDDHVVEAVFDAEPWFIQASDTEIIALAGCGWGGGYPADDVAIFLADVNGAVKRMFTYLELVRHNKDHPGFECFIEQRSAIAWIVRHRSHLGAFIPRLGHSADEQPEFAP